MSIDVYFQDGSAEGLAVEELDRTVLAALARSGAVVSEPDSHGYSIVETKSGSDFEWIGPRVDRNGKEKKSATAVLRGLDKEIAACLFDVAHDTGWFMLPAMEDLRTVRIAGRTEPLADPNMPELLDIASAEELLEFLGGGYDAWKAYRDRMVR